MGSDDTTSSNELKKIILLNIFCYTWHLFSFFSFLEDFFQSRVNSRTYIGMLLLVLSVQALQYFKKFYAARLLFIFYMIISILYFANISSPSELLEYYLLLPPILSLIYIDNRKINIAILIICLLALYIPNLYYKHYPYSVLNNMNPPFLFFSIYIVVSYFKNLNMKNEKILETKTKELEELDQFKSQFFTNISHEIRTPLTLINGQVAELDQIQDTSPEIKTIQTNIKKQINTITDMVDNVLDLAKMQSSNFSLQLKPMNVSQIVHKLYLNFEPLFKQKKIAFRIEENKFDYITNVDTLFFERTINNIVLNALKYTEKGEVRISITKENQYIHIAISDTGIGIAKNDLKAVFNRFYQVHNDINTAGGSGVGLAFSKEIIELHGGKLHLESQINIGSVFTIILPFITSQPAIPKTSPVTEKHRTLKPIHNNNTSAITALVVDDNYEMRQYVISILQHYSCIEASNGQEALDIIATQQIHFIITDYMMPKLNGYELVTQLKKKNISIPIVMLTAKTDTNTKLGVLKLGIDDYITKPFDREELLTRVQNCIKNYTSRNQYNEKNDIELEANDDFIAQLQQYIYEKSHDTNLNQEIIAKEFNLSKSSFYRKIKSETGLTPNNFIKEIRLLKAKEILETKPSILLKQLALEVGFVHDTYFSKIYTDRFGIKPTKTTN